MKNTIVFIPSQGAAFKETTAILTKQLQDRGLNMCVVTEDDYGLKNSPQEQADAIMKVLEEKNCIPAARKDEEVYSKEDEEKIKKRLEDLGYL